MSRHKRGNRNVINSGAELDWGKVLSAAQNIREVASDSHYVAPENVEQHLANVQKVCHEIDNIVEALRIQLTIESKLPTPDVN